MLLDRLYLQILRISSEFGEVIAKGKETTAGAKKFRKRTKKRIERTSRSLSFFISNYNIYLQVRKIFIYVKFKIKKSRRDLNSDSWIQSPERQPLHRGTHG